MGYCASYAWNRMGLSRYCRLDQYILHRYSCMGSLLLDKLDTVSLYFT